MLEWAGGGPSSFGTIYRDPGPARMAALGFGLVEGAL
jgi:hypothetical protein